MTCHQLRTEKLQCAYGKNIVVKGVDLEVNTGEIVGLLGPNGAGKTTTFYMISGLIAPSEGKVYLDGRKLNQLPLHRRARLGISYLPQNSTAFGKLTVWDNILIAAEVVENNPQKQKTRIAQSLESVGLIDLAGHQARTLSGGERRRLEIARTLLTSPKFVLLDEPFSGVDPIKIEDIKTLIFQLKKSHIGVLITDHNARDLLHIMDRGYILHKGTITSQGKAEALVQDPQNQGTYFGKDFHFKTPAT